MSSRCSALTAKVRQAFPQPGSSQASTHAPPNLPSVRSLPALGKPDESSWTDPSCHCAGARRGKEIKLSLHSDAEGEEAAARRPPPALSGGDHYSRCQRWEIDHTCAHIRSSTKHDFNLLLGRYTKIPKHVKNTWTLRKKASQVWFNKMQTIEIGGREHLHFKRQLFINPFGSKILMKNERLKEKGLQAVLFLWLCSIKSKVPNTTTCFSFFFFTLIAWECVFCWFVNVKWRTLKGMMGCGAPASCSICQLSNAAFVQTSDCPRMCSPSFKGWMISGNLNVALSSASTMAASQSCYEISKVRLLME